MLENIVCVINKLSVNESGKDLELVILDDYFGITYWCNYLSPVGYRYFRKGERKRLKCI